MATVTGFRVRGTKQLQTTLRRMGAQAPRAAAAALFQEAEQIIGDAKELVSVDQGPLRASGHVQLPEVTPTGATVTMGFGGPAAPYALYQHEGIGPAVGRPAFMPPVSAVKDWVQRVIRPPADELDSVAFLVARSIGQHGFKGSKYLERPYKAAARGMAGRIAKRMSAWLRSQNAAAR